MNTRQLLAQLDAMRSVILTIQKIQNCTFQTEALLQTMGRTTDFYALANAVGQVNGALMRTCRRK